MTMADWAEKIRCILNFNMLKCIYRVKGKVTSQDCVKTFAESEFEKYRASFKIHYIKVDFDKRLMEESIKKELEKN